MNRFNDILSAACCASAGAGRALVVLAAAVFLAAGQPAIAFAAGTTAQTEVGVVFVEEPADPEQPDPEQPGPEKPDPGQSGDDQPGRIVQGGADEARGVVSDADGHPLEITGDATGPLCTLAVAFAAASFVCATALRRSSGAGDVEKRARHGRQ